MSTSSSCFSVLLHRAALVLIAGLLLPSTAFGASAIALIPASAPRGARAIVVGSGLDVPDVYVSFPSATGASVNAAIVSRSASLLELTVPAAATSGPVQVTSGTTTIATFTFTLSPDPGYAQVTTLAGTPSKGDDDDGDDKPRALHEPRGVAVTPSGDVYVADTKQHRIVRVSPAGAVSVVAGSGQSGYSDGAGTAARFKEPHGIVYDAARACLYVSDQGNRRIRKVSLTGAVSTFAGPGKESDLTGFKEPSGLALDGAGNLYVADRGGDRILMVTPAGVVSVVAGGKDDGLKDGPAAQARFRNPEGVAATAAGVLFVSDTGNDAVRRIGLPDGSGVRQVTTVVASDKVAENDDDDGDDDGDGPKGLLREPSGIAIDGAGNLLVADTKNHRIRIVNLATSPAAVSTLAGTGKSGYVDGALAMARFHEPVGIAVQGAIYIADAKNDAIRVLHPALKLTDLYPRRGPLAGGNVIRIFGSGFLAGATEVRFGPTIAAALTFVASTEILATVPAGTAGAVDILVKTPAGTATLSGKYSYLAAPTFTAIQPAAGPTTGGTAITIAGDNFVPGATTATLGGAPVLQLTVPSASLLTGITPAGTAGSASITVMTPGGSTTLPSAFSYVAPPRITGFAPQSGEAGAVVTLTGEDFVPGGTQVTLGERALTPTSISPTQIVFTVPQGATSGRFRITTAGGNAESATDFIVRTLTSLAVAPETTSVPHRGTSQLTATATYSDGTTADVTASAVWSSSAPAIASVTAGTVRGEAPGSATITATLGDSTDAATVTVTRVATSLAIAPLTLTLAAGASDGLIATVTYSDGTTSDVTATAVWSTSSADVATASSGTVTAIAAGTSTITATAVGVSGTAEVIVNPATPTLTPIVVDPANATIGPGQSQAFTATATYNDGSSGNVTNEATWSSSDTVVATVNGSGVASGVAPGNATITANFEGRSASANLAVARVLTQISVAPAPVSIVLNATRQLTATAMYSDGTTVDVTDTATWTSSNQLIAEVDAAGFMFGIAPGETTITATFDSLSGNARATVTATGIASSLAITPASSTAGQGSSTFLTATLTYSDGSWREVSDIGAWSSNAPSVATVSGGWVDTLTLGTATITATFENLSASATVTVVLAVTGLSIEPGTLTLIPQATGRLTVTAVYSDGTTADATTLAEWTSFATETATVAQGVVTAVAIGNAEVMASFGGSSASAAVTVTPVPVSFTIEPATLTLDNGQSAFLIAMLHYADGTSRNVSNTAVWSTSAPDVASIVGGTVEALGPGTATITASDSGLSAGVTVNVPAVLLSLSVAPDNDELLPGATRSLRAFKQSTDGTSVDVTASVAWTSSAPGVASVDANGIVTANAPGQARIKATAADVGWSTLAGIIVRPSLASISVTPQPVYLTAGATRPFAVRGTYVDGAAGDVTRRTSWTSSNSSVATVGATGRVTAVAAGNATITAIVDSLSTSASLTVEAAITNPPDPVLIAPPIDPTKVTTVHESTRFLYEGATRVQTGVAPGTIVVERAAVLRGRVLDRSGNSLAAVKITILDHSELGQTFSRGDGRFDLAVNGGAPLTLHFERDGYMSLQRQVPVSWNSYSIAPDVAMTAFDTNVSTIATGATTYQVARGSRVLDERGPRQETLLFKPGTQATMVFPDGTTQPLSSLAVRATEYTVGDDGLAAMPAGLPPESGYTYCVELSADEAIAVGATSVRFDRPVVTYIEEFLRIPVGINIPNGYYDRERGVWVAAPDGRVVMIMAIVEGRAYLDVTGDGAEDGPSVLDPLGITTAEREELGRLYVAGQKLWRVQVDHFTPWDHNFGLVPKTPWDAPGGGGPPSNWKPAKGCKTECGSIIDVEDQTLGEQVGVTGTPFVLSYSSRQMPGFRPGYRVVVPLTGASAPDGAKRVEAIVSIAGRTYKHVTGNGANQKFDVEWDGRDAYEREVQGAMLANITLAYYYDGIWMFPGGRRYSFADFSKDLVDTGLPAPPLSAFEVSRTVSWQVPLGNWQATGAGLGAWSLSVHHAYDPVRRVLHLGTGKHRTAEAIGPVVHTVAGTGECCGSTGDGGRATAANLEFPRAIAVAPDGALYIAEDTRVRQVDRNGIIRTVAGNGLTGEFDSGHDGLVDGPAMNVPVSPQDLAVGRDGSVYMSEGTRVRQLLGESIITIAGSGRYGSEGDDGDARKASFAIQGMAVALDGGLLVVDSSSSSSKLRRISTAGRVTTIAGGRGSTSSPDEPPASGGRAVDADLRRLTAVASGSSGNIYLAGPNEFSRRITPEGIIDNFGPSDGSFSTDFDGVSTPLAVDDRERVFSGTRFTDPHGETYTFAGGGTDLRDGALALGSSIGSVRDVAVGPDGTRYILEYSTSRVRKVGASLPGLGATDILIPSSDASEEYVFSAEGRHLQTRDAVTGVVRYRFEYDSERLIRIIDADGEQTTIERDGAGKPTAIVAPGGQRSPMTINGSGYLTEIANPAGEAMSFTYWPGGLLKTFTDPNLYSSIFTYDDQGRLARDADVAGGQVALSRTGNDEAYQVSTTSGENRTKSYSVTNQKDGTVHRTATNAWGQTVLSSRSGGGVTSTIMPGGVQITAIETPDPRFGMQAPMGSGTMRTPSGLTMSSETSRTETRSNPTDLSSPLQSVQWKLRLNSRNFTSMLHVPSRTLTSTSAMGRVSQSMFDAADRLVSSSVPGLQSVGLGYDGRGRLTEVSQGTRMTTFGYDSRNRLTTVTDPLQRAVTFAYDNADRVTRQTFSADGRFIDFTYDRNGNLTSVTPPSRPQHLFGFTPMNLTERYMPPAVANGGVTFYEYNKDRQITRLTRPDSKTLALGYDNGGRVSTLTIGRGAFTFGYSASTGALQSAQTPEGNGITYSYDGSLLTGAEWTGAVAGSISWQYDNNFRVTSERVVCAAATTAACQPVMYSFDNDDLLLSAGALNLQRRADNGLLTGSTIGSIADAWTYNSFAEPVSYSASYAGAPIFAQQYTRDEVGRVTQRVETIAGATLTKTYIYAESGRLHEVRTDGTLTASYTYDENGNRLTKTGIDGSETATIDDQDRLLTYNEVRFDYTANGELRSKTDPLGTTTFDYDELGNLLKVVLPDARTIEYVTDARNRRIGRKIDGVTVQRWVYAGTLSPSAELDGQGNVIARFIYATRPNVPDVIIKGDTTYRVITDHLGSPRLILDATTGAVIQQLEYDEFGNVLSDSNPGFQPFGFAGGLYDRDTGLVRFGARDYDPHTGRWTAKDPSLFTGGANLYAYTFGDPVNFIDRDGRIPLPLVTGIIGGLAGGIGSALGQILVNGGFDCFSWTDVAVATGVGAAAGALAPITATTYIGAAITGGVANLAQTYLTDAAHARQSGFSEYAGSAVAGALGGVIGGPVTRGGAGFNENTLWGDRDLFRRVNQTENVRRAIGDASRSGASGFISNTPQNGGCGCP